MSDAAKNPVSLNEKIEAVLLRLRSAPATAWHVVRDGDFDRDAFTRYEHRASKLTLRVDEVTGRWDLRQLDTDYVLESDTQRVIHAGLLVRDTINAALACDEHTKSHRILDDALAILRERRND